LQAFLIIGIALSSKNINSQGYAGGTTPELLPAVVSGFSLAGEILGLLVSFTGFYLAARLVDHRIEHLVVIWIFVLILAVWLLGGAVAAQSLTMARVGVNPIWNSQLAFNVLSSFYFAFAGTVAASWIQQLNK